MARALAHVHSLGLLHADVKADNVLLRSDAARPPNHVSAKLSDFGLSKVCVLVWCVTVSAVVSLDNCC